MRDNSGGGDPNGLDLLLLVGDLFSRGDGIGRRDSFRYYCHKTCGFESHLRHFVLGASPRDIPGLKFSQARECLILSSLSLIGLESCPLTAGIGVQVS